MITFALTLALLAFGSEPEDNKEVEAAPEVSQTNICELGFTYQLTELRRGTKYYEEDLKKLRADLKKCGRTFSDIGVSASDLKDFEFRGCVAKARSQYIRNSGNDPAGERVYLRNLRQAFQKCGMPKFEVRFLSCRIAKDTKNRSNGYCEMFAGGVE